MIIKKYDDYFLIKILNNKIGDFNFFDINSIKNLFQDVFSNLMLKYKLHGFIEADVFVCDLYGIIIELREIDNYSNELDVNIKLHLNEMFLVIIDHNGIFDYEDVYFYKDKFYGIYKKDSDCEIIYKNTSDIINNGIKVC